MALLPARIPDIPETRAGVVPARLARKVGPLFGVTWPEGPLGARTWVSDFARITLTEIARGAPLAPRAQSGATPPEGGWAIVDRVGVSAPGMSLPNELANATLNRFGPDTKAAVVLTAVNELLAELHTALDDTLDLLRDPAGSPLPLAVQMAGWGSVLVEVFRSQPALVAAGIRARAIQRQLCATWDLAQAPGGHVPLTRCEIGAEQPGRAPSRPTELAIVDGCLAGLRTRVADPLDAAERVAEIADLWLGRLLAVGTLRDASHLWLSERAPGSLVVEAMVPPTSLVARTVRRALEIAGEPPHELVLPAIPDAAVLRTLSPAARRTWIVAVLGIIRFVQVDPELRERTRRAVLDVVGAVGRTLDQGLLAPDDPLAAIARCRIAIVQLHTRRFDRTTELDGDLTALLAAADRCADLGDAGVLDRGAAAEILGAANIEVNAVRWTNADHGGVSRHPESLDAWLRLSWTRQLALLEIDPEGLHGLPGTLGYHLHNYAAFLASHTESTADLRAAVELFQHVVIPARAAFRTRTGSAEPLRHSLQVGSRSTTALSRAALAAGDRDAAQEWARLGRAWVVEALTDAETATLLAEPTEIACRFALQVAPALRQALELGVGTAEDLTRAADLVALAQAWEVRAGGAERHVRHGEIAELTTWLDAISGRRRPDVDSGVTGSEINGRGITGRGVAQAGPG